MTVKKDTKTKFFRTADDLPIWNWRKISETDDLRYLIKSEDYDELIDEDKVNLEQLQEAYFDIQNEVNELMTPDTISGHYLHEHIELLEMKKQELIMMCQGGDPMLSVTRTKIKQKEVQLASRSTGTRRQTLEEQAVILELFFKITIDVKKTSTKKFYLYQNNYDKQIAEHEQRKFENEHKRTS